MSNSLDLSLKQQKHAPPSPVPSKRKRQKMDNPPDNVDDIMARLRARKAALQALQDEEVLAQFTAALNAEEQTSEVPIATRHPPYHQVLQTHFLSPFVYLFTITLCSSSYMWFSRKVLASNCHQTPRRLSPCQT